MTTPSSKGERIVERVARASERVREWIFSGARSPGREVEQAIVEDIDTLRQFANAALASEREALVGDVERLRELGGELVSACRGLEWNSFTQAGWDRVRAMEAALAKVEASNVK